MCENFDLYFSATSYPLAFLHAARVNGLVFMGQITRIGQEQARAAALSVSPGCYISQNDTKPALPECLCCTLLFSLPT